MGQSDLTLKQIKEQLFKAIKYKDNVSIAVKVYDCDEDDRQTYDVEINYYIHGSYEDGWFTDTFYEGEEKLAVKRAKSVLKTVKGWFEYKEDIEVIDEVEVYHA